MNANDWIRWFETLTNDDVSVVGGKNASLGEMVRALGTDGIRVPDGFATTAHAYRRFIEANHLAEPIKSILADYQAGRIALREAGGTIRRLIRKAPLPEPLVQALRGAYRELGQRYGSAQVDVAVRSSATAEDLPEASFAGQQETFLNIRGEEALLEACKQCFASLFTDRALTYREMHGFDHMQVALSVGVQKMVRSDRAGAGVLFTLDTESGFPDVVLINAAWGLGENVVKGTVNPDQYMVFKPLLNLQGLAPIIEKKVGTKAKKMVYVSEEEVLRAHMALTRWEEEGGRVTAAETEERKPGTLNIDTPEDEQRRFVLDDADILQLARWGVTIERHYGKPMDIEWAKDGESGALFIVQARPETVQARAQQGILKTYTLKGHGERLLTGQSIGSSIATGTVRRVLNTADLASVESGAILVAQMTDPDWVPAMRKAAGIVTDFGGRTCHAAIVSRELGIPAVVGTGDATQRLADGQAITVSCAEGEQGYVYDGVLDVEVNEVDVDALPRPKTKIMLNMAAPDAALQWWRLPASGIGLARMEFIVGQWIKVHPMALVHFDTLADEAAKAEIAALTRDYADKTEYFVEHLARGIAKLAASQYPEPVIVRMSDFKTNEYAHLIGGQAFEPEEENPMIGWRGASRYYSEDYQDAFALECRALGRVREAMGFDNVAVMIPFCRTPKEADRVLEVMARHGLRRGEQGLKVYVMCEVPSNVVLADRFAPRFDGFSIGSNDLTQLVLGVDRDSTRLAYLFDERDEAVLRMIRDVIGRAHEAGCTVGICGQAPSDYPDFVDFLVEAGIDSMSLNPDSFVTVTKRVAEAEARVQPVTAVRAPAGNGKASSRPYMSPD